MKKTIISFGVCLLVLFGILYSVNIEEEDNRVNKIGHGRIPIESPKIGLAHIDGWVDSNTHRITLLRFYISLLTNTEPNSIEEKLTTQISWIDRESGCGSKGMVNILHNSDFLCGRAFVPIEINFDQFHNITDTSNIGLSPGSSGMVKFFINNDVTSNLIEFHVPESFSEKDDSVDISFNRHPIDLQLEPFNGEADVDPENLIVKVHFLENLNITQCDMELVNDRNRSNKIVGDFQYDNETNIASFKPRDRLDYDNVYTTYLHLEIMSKEYDLLEDNMTFIFQTGKKKENLAFCWTDKVVDLFIIAGIIIIIFSGILFFYKFNRNEEENINEKYTCPNCKEDFVVKCTLENPKSVRCPGCGFEVF